MRYIIHRLLFIVPFMAFSWLHAQEQGKTVLWYEKPAEYWNEALPLGNGRLGAMVFGGTAVAKIQLNESSFWSGGPSRNDNPNALEALSEVRNLIFAGKHKEAETLINQNITASRLHGSKYQPVGDLILTFNGHENYEEYSRKLDLRTAVHKTSYTVNNVTYSREIIASNADEVIAIKLTSSAPGMLSFSAGLSGPLEKTNHSLDDHSIEMTGISGSHEGVTGQVKFTTRLKIINTGGSTINNQASIDIIKADEVLILLSIATNFKDYAHLTADENQICQDYLIAAEQKTCSELFSRHTQAYQKFFNRVSIDLGSSSASEHPIDTRLRNFSGTNDPELVALYYQFGRYLLISSSQPGGQPANLQGIWNDQVNPAWDSKYTININTEMNYWPAEKCNLSEMHEPLIRMVKDLAETGRQTARTMYDCEGWVAHHNTDIWRITGVVDGAFWGMWPMGGAWLSQHLWEKYLYSGDEEYLEDVYPVLRSACEFYEDFLIEEPIHKWLVVSPSISPENAPAGHGTSVTYGTTMDNQLLFDLFNKTITASKILKKDSIQRGRFQELLDRLPPMQVGQYGQLQEWIKDWDNPEDKHRHISHLYGLYPGNQISPYSSPELFEAARTSLLHRGDVSTGWSMGWKVNFWARLLDGNHALKLITDQLTLVHPDSSSNGGTYPNLFDAHPPFQIDGNFGCTSGITEMLMQSHDGAIYLLPALPDAWHTGEISGLRTVGGFELSLKWKNKKITELSIKSNLGGNCRIRVPNELMFQDGAPPKSAAGTNPNSFFVSSEIKTPLIADKTKINAVNLQATYLDEFNTVAGESYTLVSVDVQDAKTNP